MPARAAGAPHAAERERSVLGWTSSKCAASSLQDRPGAGFRRSRAVGGAGACDDRAVVTDWAEGRDGEHPRYTERLFPPWWLWLVAVGFSASLGIAYWYALGRLAGVLVGVTAGGLAVVGLLAASPRVRVDDRVFRAGRARLPLRYVGAVAALDREHSLEARGVGLDPAAHLLLRTLGATRLVLVEVTDERDPHPYWLVSSRRPDELARVLRESARDPGPRRAGSVERLR